MKKIGILILFTTAIILGLNRNLSAVNQGDKKQDTNRNTDEHARVSIGKDIFSFEEGDSAYDIRVGNRGLKILESLEGPKFNFEKFSKDEEWDQDGKDNDHSRKLFRFKGHWTGIELGFNNYVTSGKVLQCRIISLT